MSIDVEILVSSYQHFDELGLVPHVELGPITQHLPENSVAQICRNVFITFHFFLKLAHVVVLLLIASRAATRVVQVVGVLFGEVSREHLLLVGVYLEELHYLVQAHVIEELGIELVGIVLNRPF